MGSSGSRWNPSRRVAEDHRPGPVAAADRREPVHGGDGERHIGLGASRGAEPHRRRAIDDQRRLQLVVRLGVSHVSALRPGRDVPVDPSDVVARLVGSGLTRSASRSRQQAPMIPLEETLDPTRDGDVEMTQTVERDGIHQ